MWEIHYMNSKDKKQLLFLLKEYKVDIDQIIIDNKMIKIKDLIVENQNWNKEQFWKVVLSTPPYSEVFDGRKGIEIAKKMIKIVQKYKELSNPVIKQNTNRIVGAFYSPNDDRISLLVNQKWGRNWLLAILVGYDVEDNIRKAISQEVEKLLKKYDTNKLTNRFFGIHYSVEAGSSAAAYGISCGEYQYNDKMEGQILNLYKQIK